MSHLHLILKNLYIIQKLTVTEKYNQYKPSWASYTIYNFRTTEPVLIIFDLLIRLRLD